MTSAPKEPNNEDVSKPVPSAKQGKAHKGEPSPHRGFKTDETNDAPHPGQPHRESTDPIHKFETDTPPSMDNAAELPTFAYPISQSPRPLSESAVSGHTQSSVVRHFEAVKSSELGGEPLARKGFFRAIGVVSVVTMPLLWLGMSLRGKKNTPLARRAELRGKTRVQRPKDVPLIWLHAVSVGEARSALLMVEALTEQYPHSHFLLTTRTATAAIVVQRSQLQNLIHQYTPWECTIWINRFLRHWKPDFAIWFESELWPVLLPKAQAYCPTVLVQARLSAESWKKWDSGAWGSAASLLQGLLGGFDAVFVQNPEQQSVFRQAGAARVHFHGNMKHVPPQGGYHEALAVVLQQLQRHSQGQMWAGLSTHSPEEKKLSISHFMISESHEQVISVIVPRHPQRGATIKSEIESTGLACWLYSETVHTPEGMARMCDHLRRGGVLIVDVIGAVGTVCSFVKVVFVGGSWVPLGGHNLAEPAHAGCVVMHGPKMWNFDALVTALHAEFAVEMVADGGILADRVTFYLNNPKVAEQKGIRAHNWVAQQRDIPSKIVQGMVPYLPVAVSHHSD